MPVYIGSTSGYMRLDSWVLSKVLQLGVNDFCRRYFNRTNDPCGRQFDQTTQAARAVSANIAEGSARHQTSAETEMKLLDVARASLSEVIDDLAFVLLTNTPSSPRTSMPPTPAMWPTRSSSSVCESSRCCGARWKAASRSSGSRAVSASR